MEKVDFSPTSSVPYPQNGRWATPIQKLQTFLSAFRSTTNRRSLRLVLLFFVFALGFLKVQTVSAQCCLTSSLIINTGYNPLTGGVMPTAVGSTTIDPKWTMYAVSPSCTAITGYVASPNAYDVVGGPLAPTTVTSGPTTSLSFINSETYTTVATGTYSFKAQRSFNLCQGTFVTISMTITADDWVGAVAVDATILGAGTFPEPAGWGVGFTPKSVTQTLYLPSGVHYIYVTSNNMPENGWQGNSLDVVGTVTSATPLAIDREDIASCSPGQPFAPSRQLKGLRNFAKDKKSPKRMPSPGAHGQLSVEAHWSTL